MKYQNKISTTIMILPGLLLAGSIIVYPLIQVIITSFFKWQGLGYQMEFVGFNNYIKIFNDDRFLQSLENNVLWLLMYLILPVLSGFLLALLLNTNIRGENAFKSIYYIPAVISFSVIGVIWGIMYDNAHGMINEFLSLINLDFLKNNWLGTRSLALPSVVVASSWQYTGFCMVLFLSALQQVPKDQIDAADVDGAKFYQKVLHIILPNIKPVTIVILMVTIINSFRIFALIYIITEGGPMRATDVIGFVMYQETFGAKQWGIGSCYAVILLLLTALPAAFYVRQMLTREEIY
jgi:ABC-type sugar transport system permease subunit